MAQSISTNTFGVAKFVVSPDPTQGTHTTINAAIASASSGDIIWVREGTYTENLTNKNGVTVQGIATNGGSVVMGSLTISNAGTCFFSNLNFVNASGASLVISGSSTVVVTLENLVFNSSTSGVNTINMTNPNTGGSRFFGCDFRNDTVQNFVITVGGDLSFINCSFSDNSSLNNTLNGSGGAFTWFFNNSSLSGSIYITNGAQFNAVSSSFNSGGSSIPTILLDSNNVNTGFEFCTFLAATYNFQINSPGTCRMLSCNLQSSSVTPLVQGNGSVRYALIVSGFGNSPIFDPALTVQPIPVKLGNATNFTRISVADTPYTVLSTDEYISVDTSGGAVTVLFPDTPAIGQEWTVKDATGNALLNNITITTVSGTDFIDGSTIDTIASAYGAVNLIASSSSSYQTY